MKQKIKYSELKLEQLVKPDNTLYDVNSVDEAYSFVCNIAKQHYENFVVGSVLVPRKIRKYFFSIYAFARIADDIADELVLSAGVDAANLLLDAYQKLLESIFDKSNNIRLKNPVFIAIKDTVEKNNLSILPLVRLLSAFRQDINFKRLETFSDLFEYCNNSVNPVGELILSLFKEATPKAVHYSNCVCTALQLINF